MPHFVEDFVDQLGTELAKSRVEQERVLERTEALAALHSRALDLAAELNRPMSAHDLFQSARTERERAELQLLAERATSRAGDPAYGNGRDPGGHLETGAGS